MDLKESVIKTVSTYAKNDKNILSVYLLGSVNSGVYRVDSDIDLAILMKDRKPLPVLERVEIANQLTIKLGRTVDLGVITSKNLIYASEAFFKGDMIYTTDQYQNDLIRCTLIGLYYQLNIDRKEILDAYRA